MPEHLGRRKSGSNPDLYGVGPIPVSTGFTGPNFFIPQAEMFSVPTPREVHTHQEGRPHTWVAPFTPANTLRVNRVAHVQKHVWMLCTTKTPQCKGARPPYEEGTAEALQLPVPCCPCAVVCQLCVPIAMNATIWCATWTS